MCRVRSENAKWRKALGSEFHHIGKNFPYNCKWEQNGSPGWGKGYDAHHNGLRQIYWTNLLINPFQCEMGYKADSHSHTISSNKMSQSQSIENNDCICTVYTWCCCIADARATRDRLGLHEWWERFLLQFSLYGWSKATHDHTRKMLQAKLHT